MKRRKDWFDYVNTVLLTLLMLLVIIPFYFTVVKAFTTPNEWTMSGGTLFFPRQPTLNNFTSVLDTGRIGTAYLNTLFYVVAGVAYCMFMTLTLAYGLSRKSYPGRRFFQNFVLFTMFFGGGLIPFFLVVKDLGMIGSRLALILPFGLNLFNMIIMRTAFEQLPPDLEEAAIIDGANPLTIFARIHLPLVKPMMATIVLFYAVDRWNEWFYASLFLGDSDLWPIQLTLRQILWNTGTFTQNIPAEAGRKLFSEGIKAASVLLVMMPVMCVYPFLQKYFVKGVMIGAIKS